MNNSGPLKIAIIAGEESGDLLGRDLVQALKKMTDREVSLVGVGGYHLEGEGLRSLFDAHEIALMGVAAILRDLPRLIRRIGETARAIAAAKPDCLITIDSPEFSLRVAKKLRAAAPGIPIVHYVCPSVWAWRPGRARAMKPYVDHILCLLPFEPDELKRLDGPAGTFVGHRLSTDAGVALAAEMQAARNGAQAGEPKNLLLLPGSRRGEVKSLLADFGATVDVLRARGQKLNLVLPTVPRLEAHLREQTASWTQKPEIITDPQKKFQAFGQADAALIASGTVSLELGLAGVPMVSCYKIDAIGMLFHRLVTVWSALLPNIIADKAVVPEFYNQYVRPQHLARDLEALLENTPARQWQRDGFAEVRRRLATSKPSGELAAEIVLRIKNHF